jgi:integrase
VRAGYYSWTSPETGVEHGLGRDRKHAIATAMQANAYVALKRPSLIDQITGKADHTWGKWLVKYRSLISSRDLEENTRRTYKSLLGKLDKYWPSDKPLKDISTAMIAEILDATGAAGKARSAQQMRSFLKDCFRECIAQGWIERNPVDPTRAVAVKVKRARLSLEVFQSVYTVALPWLRNAMLLALLTGQRREDITDARFANVKDGYLQVEQSKTGRRLAIPLVIGLKVIGKNLDDVIRQCRSTGVLSPFLVHQTEDYGNSPRGSQIWKDTLSRRFTDTLEPLKIDWEGKNPPTFHEIRSLAERLYSAQGDVNTQDLLGHSEARMTSLYHDSRGDWVKIKVGTV